MADTTAASAASQLASAVSRSAWAMRFCARSGLSRSYWRLASTALASACAREPWADRTLALACSTLAWKSAGSITAISWSFFTVALKSVRSLAIRPLT